MAPYLSIIKKWAKNGSWSLIDQAFYAGANFIVSILLARYFTQITFGQFAFVYSIYIFLQMAYRAFWYAPLMYFGSKNYKKGFSYYNSRLIIYQFYATIIILCIITIGYNIVSDIIYLSYVDVIILLCSISAMLLCIFIRKSCYVLFKPKVASLGSIIYAVILLLLLVLLINLQQLTIRLVFVIFGLSSILSFLFIYKKLKYKIDSIKDLILSKKDLNIILKHYNYGKWLLAAAVLTWVSNQVYYSFFISYDLTKESGALKALMVLVQPIYHINIGLSSLLVPALVRANKNNQIVRYFQKSMLATLVISITYSALLFAFGDNLISLIYGDQSEYLYYDKYIIYIGILPILHTIMTIYGAWFQAINKPVAFTYAYAISAVVTIIIGFLLIPSIGFLGAVIGLLASNLITVFIFILVKHLKI